ncbi:MAG: histidinol phosphatase [Betaproteobacteria bacterium]|nr:histidinol phosphatase [Betaproteobacteria bacterium]
MNCFIRLASVALLLSSSAGLHAQDLRVFPPAPPVQSPIAGAIDFHVHSAPDVFGRSVTDIEAATLARRMDMRAIVLKNHVTATADRAAITREVVPGIEVFGGVVLNRAVGGVNPDAVEWMSRMSGRYGKVVWLPTIDAAHHMKTFGVPGEGLRVVVDGTVTPETDAVLRIIARENLVLETGHVSPEEVIAVIRRGRDLGVRNMLVTHATAQVPNLSVTQMREVAALGGYLELDFIGELMGPDAHLPWMRHWRHVSIAEMAATIRAVGPEHIVLATDLGQTGNPTQPDGMIMLVQGLRKAGIPEEDLQRMMRTNPARLLGLPSL